MTKMDKWERLEASIQQQPTDRNPWALWRHFYDRETSAEGLADAMLEWQGHNDFDLLKVNPRAEYHAEAWGCRFRYSGKPDIKPIPEQSVIMHAEDWQKLEVQTPANPAFAEQLQALTRIGRGLHGAVPFVETVFCPLAIAGSLVHTETMLKEHLRQHPALMHQALATITASLVPFVHEILNAGASGIFLATTAWATRDMLTEEESAEFGRPYDLQVLAAAREARVNILHVCRQNNMLRSLQDYPVHILHWAATEPGNPSLEEVADAVTARAVSGGLSKAALTAKSDTPALSEAAQAANQARNRGLILAGDCSIPIQTTQKRIDTLHRWLL